MPEAAGVEAVEAEVAAGVAVAAAVAEAGLEAAAGAPAALRGVRGSATDLEWTDLRLSDQALMSNRSAADLRPRERNVTPSGAANPIGKTPARELDDIARAP